MQNLFAGLNPNIEYRNSKQSRILKIQMTERIPTWVTFISSFVLVIGTFVFKICFEFRVLDFEFTGYSEA
jgi:hypothetical protein